MDTRKGFSRELQISLGEKLRELYSTFVQTLPLRFVLQARRIRDPNSQKDRRTVVADTFQSTCGAGFDPETVAILEEAFDRAWKDLDSLSTNIITQNTLAVRLITLLNNGERNASRLATKAVLELVTRELNAQ